MGNIETMHMLTAKAQDPSVWARRLLPQGKWITEREAIDRLTPPEEHSKRRVTGIPDGRYTDTHTGITPIHQIVPQVNDSLAYARLQALWEQGIVQFRGVGRGARDVRMKTDAELAEHAQRLIEERDRAKHRVTVTLTDADGNLIEVPREDAEYKAGVINAEIRRRRAANARADLDGLDRPYPNTH